MSNSVRDFLTVFACGAVVGIIGTVFSWPLWLSAGVGFFIGMNSNKWIIAPLYGSDKKDETIK